MVDELTHAISERGLEGDVFGNAGYFHLFSVNIMETRCNLTRNLYVDSIWNMRAARDGVV